VLRLAKRQAMREEGKGDIASRALLTATKQLIFFTVGQRSYRYLGL